MKTSIFIVRLLIIGLFALDAFPSIAMSDMHSLPTGSVRLCNIDPGMPIYLWLSDNEIMHTVAEPGHKDHLYLFNLKTRKDRMLPESFSADPKYKKRMKIVDTNLEISNKWMSWSSHVLFHPGLKAPESLEHGLPKKILVFAEFTSPDHKLRLWIIRNISTKLKKHDHISSKSCLAVSSMSGANFHVIASFKPSSDAAPYWPINWSPSGRYFSFVLNGGMYIAPVPKL